MRGIGTKLANTTRSAAAVLAMCAATAGVARADVVVSGVTVLAPGSVVAGQSIAQWSTKWWQWAYAQGTPNDAFTDATGARAGLNQSGPVFFVAGISGPMGNTPQTRTFSVPGNAYLLVPLLNAEQSQAEYEASFSIPNATDDQLKAELAKTVDLITGLHASIDGTPVPGDLFLYKETSDLFHYTADPNNVFGSPAGDSGNAFAQGYYLMLAPFGTGTHSVAFGGVVPEFKFSVDVTDTISAPEPASLSLLAVGLAGIAVLHRRRARAEAR